MIFPRASPACNTHHKLCGFCTRSVCPRCNLNAMKTKSLVEHTEHCTWRLFFFSVSRRSLIISSRHRHHQCLRWDKGSQGDALQKIYRWFQQVKGGHGHAVFQTVRLKFQNRLNFMKHSQCFFYSWQWCERDFFIFGTFCAPLGRWWNVQTSRQTGLVQGAYTAPGE